MQIKLLSKSIIPISYQSIATLDFELMVHGLLFSNDSAHQVDVKEISLSLAKGNERIFSKYLSNKNLKNELKNAGDYYNRSLGFPEALSIWLSKKVPRNANCVASPRLNSSDGCVIQNQYFHIKDIKPTKLIVDIIYIEKGKEKSASRSFALREYRLKNKYILPLKGNIWGLLGPSTGSSYHRQMASQEFAYDFVMFDSKGKIQKGKGTKNTDYYCYKKEIIAPASGKIIYARDGLEDNQMLDGTPPIDREKIKKWGFTHTLAGNFIVMEHKDNEYSLIAHCAKDSIKVKENQRVKQGQPLALLGNTGNSTGPHLHYHLMDGPDLLESRSLPVRFENTSPYPWEEGDEAFDFWETRDPMIRSTK